VSAPLTALLTVLVLLSWVMKSKNEPRTYFILQGRMEKKMSPATFKLNLHCTVKIVDSPHALVKPVLPLLSLSIDSVILKTFR